MIFNVSKDNMIKAGIYMIKNIDNGKVYIGQTKNIYGLKDFANKHNLAVSNLYSLIIGKLKTYKGWKVA